MDYFLTNLLSIETLKMSFDTALCGRCVYALYLYVHMNFISLLQYMECVELSQLVMRNDKYWSSLLKLMNCVSHVVSTFDLYAPFQQ